MYGLYGFFQKKCTDCTDFFPKNVRIVRIFFENVRIFVRIFSKKFGHPENAFLYDRILQGTENLSPKIQGCCASGIHLTYYIHIFIFFYIFILNWQKTIILNNLLFNETTEFMFLIWCWAWFRRLKVFLTTSWILEFLKRFGPMRRGLPSLQLLLLCWSRR